MQIEKITIKNFKGIESSEFTPSHFNLLIGTNGSGKSSHLDAIRYALTGEPSANILKHGTKKGSVSITAFGNTTIERSFGTKSVVKVNNSTTTQKALKEFLEKNCGVKYDTIKIITFGKMLASMSAGDLSKFLVSSKLIPVEIDMQKFLDLCPISRKAQKEIKIMLPEAPVKFNIDAIKEAYEYFYSCRAENKRTMDTMYKKSLYDKSVPTKDLAAIDKSIAAISAKKHEGEIYNKLYAAYEKAVEERNKKIASLKALENEIKNTIIKKPDENIKASAEAQIADIKRRIEIEARSLNLCERNIELFQKTLDSLNTSICPLHEKLVCSTDKTAIKEDIERLIDENNEQKNLCIKRIEECERRKKNAKEAILKYTEEYEQYIRARAMYDKYEAYKGSIPELPEKPEAPFLPDEIEKRLNELSDLRNRRIEYDLAQTAHEEYLKLKKEYEVHDELTKALNPKGGIIEKVIAFAFKPLVEYCNTLAKSVKPEFKLAVEVNDGVKFLCQPNATSGYLGLNEVSSGEQLVALYLILDMLNALSGFRILMIDDLDKLDSDSLQSLIEILDNPEVSKRYDHIFLATVNHDDAVKTFKKHPGIQSICL